MSFRRRGGRFKKRFPGKRGSKRISRYHGSRGGIRL